MREFRKEKMWEYLPKIKSGRNFQVVGYFCLVIGNLKLASFILVFKSFYNNDFLLALKCVLKSEEVKLYKI